MPFSWLQRTPPRPDGAARRAEVAAHELASRAGLLYRLGYPQAEATARLCASTAWEYDQPTLHGRPAALSDQGIAKIVAETYARRPG